MQTPEPFLKGRFTLYETPDGGMHIAYLPDGDTETRHMEVPAFVIQNGRALAEGKLNPFKAIKDLMTNVT